ncbi:uncharacterized protein CANTADRAFT_45720 [Suhomyces tanzawaensis NRRL Y-17324]|uniref:Uncharacterized protein n=1 Tax=Suhomyces tanzawaensis NRRL Y-17324 TaxID=984487 RepID=A0A1E4SQS3_9ASCO|nr:uncharacterized protein CANTADRAFT_45720 [Suhomyces tanzawaensis NRRL Y-17324]ODV81863.1 hypothetical protein CANTADRAFT_45720 [Suhomyces tanzawaensis NRRL Y-17324]
MSFTNTIGYYLAVVILSWIAFWYAVYLVTGLHLSSFTINNGFLFNGISYTSSTVNVLLGSLRFRLWGNTRKIILDDLVVTFSRGNSGRSRVRGRKKRASHHEPPLAKFEVFPRRAIPRAIVRYIACHCPFVDVELRNSSVELAKDHHVSVEYAKFTLGSTSTKWEPHKARYDTTIVLNNTSHAIGSCTPVELVNFKVQVELQLDTVSGVIDDLKLRIFMNDLTVLAFSVIKYFLIDLYEAMEEKHATENQEHQHEKLVQKVQNQHENQPQQAKDKLHRTVSEISIHLENINLVEIPFATIVDNQDFSQYFGSDTPKTSLDLSIKSSFFNISKLQKDAAGFEAVFDPLIDSPFHYVSSVQLLRLHFSKLVDVNGHIAKNSDEVLNVPNWSFTYKTNIFDHLVRGDGFKNCVLELFASASSPILDLDTHQVSELFYNLVLFKKFMKLRSVKKISRKTPKPVEDDENESQDATMIEGSDDEPGPPVSQGTVIREYILKLLNDYYPRLDLKFIVEQPRIIIRHYDTPNQKVQILNFSYSLLDFHLHTTDSRNYDSNCQILSPSIRYLEKALKSTATRSEELINQNIVKVQQADFKFEILKNLKFKCKAEIEEAVIDLTKLDILRGIHNFLKDIVGMAEKDLSIGVINDFLNKEIVRVRQSLFQNRPIYPPIKLTLEEKIFKYLPAWILECQMDLRSVNILLGSRSVLIPREFITKMGEGFNDDLTRDHHGLRYVKFSLDEFSLTLNNNDMSEFHEPNFDDIVPVLTTSTASLETLTPSFNESHYWGVQSKIGNLNTSMYLNLQGKESKLATFLSLPSITFNIQAIVNELHQNQLKVDMSMDQFRVSYDRYKAFVLIGAFYLMREFLFVPIKEMLGKFKRDLKKYLTQPLSPNPTYEKKLKDFITVEFTIHDISILAHLGDDFKTKFQILKSFITFEDGIVTVNNEFLRGLTESPLVKNRWCRILCSDNLKVVVNDPNSAEKIDIHTDSIRIIQPHGFVAHRLFDNLSATIKVMKYIVQCLLLEANNRHKVIQPKESKTVKMPKLRIRSNKLAFSMEDDPFESELNMIYQLGLIEQRKRIEQESLFESKAAKANHPMTQERENLYHNFSMSWIRKVKIYKAELKKEVIENKKHLFGNEATLAKLYNEGIVTYPSCAPLLFIMMKRLDLRIRKPQFEWDHLPQFLHDLGQGMPKDMKYSLNVPMYMDLKLDELRMHLRDYPLPILYVPENVSSKRPCLSLKGHLIITEELIKDKEHVRNNHVPLSLNVKNSEEDKFYAVTIAKSLSTVKLFTELKCDFDSDLPARFVWGQSLQFGIQQAMLNFDQFSKPPVDPSVKLGFWDKMKLIMHGKCQIRIKKSLEVAFKGSSDPYDLFDTSSGFVLSFKDDVVWKINEHDDSRLFFDIESENLSWYIPNYLAAPLISWTRESSKAIYFPDSKAFITSCFGYYLQDHNMEAALSKFSSNVLEKNVVNLSGGVHFRVGFLLQRKNKDGQRTSECKPHYDVKLFNPDFTKKDHDSYKGFRSEFIHMAISFNANRESSYNSIHLSPKTFLQFFRWWKLFSGNMSLPIRRGKMFGETQKALKFSQLLYTNKFEFNFRLLFLSHIYQDESISKDGDRIEFVGIRAMIDQFSVDLHQRKESVIQVHEELSRNQKAMKMNFNVGEVHLSKIDLRVIHAVFKQDIYNNNSFDQLKDDDERNNYKIFDNDKRWFDIQDFEEAFSLSLRNCPRTFSIYPLMYAKRFSYVRDTSSDDKQDDSFGDEDTHKCSLNSNNVFQPQIESLEERLQELKEQISKNQRKGAPMGALQKRVDFLQNDASSESWASAHSESSTSGMDSKEHFNNKFILINMLLKWNFKNRNYLLKYIHFVQLKKFLRQYLSYESIAAIEEIMEKNSNQDVPSLSTGYKSNSSYPSQNPENQKSKLSSSERLERFDQILRDVPEFQGISEDYRIEIISPQIQLQSDDEPDSVVLISTPKIDSKIVSVVNKNSEGTLDNSKEFATRFGIMMKHANIFVLQKEDVVGSNLGILSRNTYGARSNWPPWLGIEICKNGLWAGEDKLLVEKTSLMIMYEQIKPLGARIGEGEGDEDEGEDDDSENASDVSASDKIGPVDKLFVDFPKLIISSTSKQYFTLYIIVLSLLFYTEPMSKEISEKLEKLKFSIDFQDLTSIHSRLKELHNYYNILKMLMLNYGFRQNTLTNEELNNFLLLNMEKGEVVTEIYLMMHSILTGDFYNDQSSSKPKANWFFKADEIILHMLEDDRTPILDIALAKGSYRRIVNEDGSNDNKLDIGMIQGFNLIKNSKYQEFLEPMNVDKIKPGNLITVDWTMNKPVGGIKIIENFEISSQALSLKIDEVTGKKLMLFIFGSDTDIEESPLLTVVNRENDGDSEDEDDDGLNATGLNGGFLEANDGINKKEEYEELKDEKSESKRSLSRRRFSKNFSLNSSSSLVDNEYQDQINNMIERSKKYFSFVSFKLQPISLLISISLNKGYKRLLNVQDFSIHLPEFIIQKKVLSFLEVSTLLQKMVIKTLLSHSGKLLKNKFSVKKKLSKKLMKPLKPLKRYVRFTPVDELQLRTTNEVMSVVE